MSTPSCCPCPRDQHMLIGGQYMHRENVVPYGSTVRKNSVVGCSCNGQEIDDTSIQSYIATQKTKEKVQRSLFTSEQQTVLVQVEKETKALEETYVTSATQIGVYVNHDVPRMEKALRETITRRHIRNLRHGVVQPEQQLRADLMHSRKDARSKLKEIHKSMQFLQTSKRYQVIDLLHVKRRKLDFSQQEGLPVFPDVTFPSSQ